MTQTSIQLDPEWAKMVNELAKKWGVKGATKILRSCTERVWSSECWNPDGNVNDDLIKESDTKTLSARKYVNQEKYRFNLKKQIVKHYGALCCKCGQNDIRYLTVDHIKGLQPTENKQERSGYRLYLRLRREGFPEGYQILCYDCNIRKQ